MSARVFVLGLCTSGVLLAGAVDASGQIVINAGDDVNFKLGLLGQFQAETHRRPRHRRSTPTTCLSGGCA